MSKPKKSEVVKIRPFEGDAEIARSLSEATGLSVIDIMSMAMSCGLKAMKKFGAPIPVPPSMEVVSPDRFSRRQEKK